MLSLILSLIFELFILDNGHALPSTGEILIEQEATAPCSISIVNTATADTIPFVLLTPPDGAESHVLTFRGIGTSQPVFLWVTTEGNTQLLPSTLPIEERWLNPENAPRIRELLYDADGQRKIYVSSLESTGASPLNPGTQQLPISTLSQALSYGPGTMLLERGSTFYESLKYNKVTLDAYGEGPLPAICGLKIPRFDNLWQRGSIQNGEWVADAQGDVYRLWLAAPDSCYLGVATSEDPLFNNIGQIVSLDDDGMNSVLRVFDINDLQDDFDFYQSTNTSDPAAFDYLYVKYSAPDGVALDKQRIGLAVGTHGLRVYNATIRNVKVTHWGKDGIVGHSGAVVDSCEVDGIGGSLADPTICYGNGIEFWIADGKDVVVENASVTNTKISRTYDCGLSIQGHNPARNIILSHNTLVNCCQSFEFFLRSKVEGEELVFDNCVTEYNLSISPGQDTGFRYPAARKKYCHILENTTSHRMKMVYRQNTFRDGNYYCTNTNAQGEVMAPVWEGNVCHIRRGQNLYMGYTGQRPITVPTSRGSFPTLEAATADAIARYRSLTSDTTTQFLITE
ncbi:MAG: right-handed parallel beta-helix repeat-containing protein [Bacteroidales bacterium]|nr:right-handed parallel beta-helix repeat-containing protein [Bacteroidales bacterium]